MKNWLLATFAGIAVLLMVAAPIFGHHGTAAYDTTKLTTVKGTVTAFQFNNPHVMISVETKDDKGKVEMWTSEANSPNVLTRHGWDRDIIKKGDQITIIGYRPKNGVKTLRLQKVVLSNGQELDPNSLQD
jgi:DNA/RNA endonuclease YhcR with UshA esterase domain